MRWLLSIIALGFLAAVNALSASGNRLLVVLEETQEKEKYSTFIGDLEERGFSIEFSSPKSEALSLFHLGERAYDHILLLPAQSKGLGPNLTPKILLEFIKAKGNILLTLSSTNPTPISLVSLLLELDIHLPIDRNALVVDHFNYDTVSSPEQHDVILLPRPTTLRPGVRNYWKGSGQNNDIIVFPHGVGQILGNGSPLLSPILRAPRSAYSYNSKDGAESVEDPFAVGPQLSLVTTMQARNSARFTVVGAAEMFQNQWFDAKVKLSAGLDGDVAAGKASSTSNREFAKEVSGWTFNEIGVLKVGRIQHYLDEGPDASANATNPKIYRVKNQVTYSIELSEYSWDKYTPFIVEGLDELQLEFSMLSPFHRLPLKASVAAIDSATYTTTFKLPDQHGIFNLMVDYKRPFLSNVEEKNTVTVRHFAHDEFDRSWTISGAWPWIGGIAVTVVGWIAFVALWLWSAPKPVKLAASGKKTQ